MGTTLPSGCLPDPPQVTVQLFASSLFRLEYDGTLTQSNLETIAKQSACGASDPATCRVKLALRQRRALSAGRRRLSLTYEMEVQQQLGDDDSAQADAGSASTTAAGIVSSIQAADNDAQVATEVEAVSTEAEVVITQQGDSQAATDLQTDLVSIDVGALSAVIIRSSSSSAATASRSKRRTTQSTAA